MSGVLKFIMDAAEQAGMQGDRPKPDRDFPPGADREGAMLPNNPYDRNEKGQPPTNDPNVIYDDTGKAVDYDTGDPITRALKGIFPVDKAGPRGQGTFTGMVSRLLHPYQEKHKPAIMEGGVASTQNLHGAPERANPAISQPRPQYAMSGMDSKSMTELKRSLWQQSGQLAAPLSHNAPVVEDTDPNGLQGRMGSPNSKAEMMLQGQEALSISDLFRRKKGASLDNPFKVAGNYIGELGPNDDITYDSSEPMGRRGEELKDPKKMMKEAPDDVEGFTHKDNPILFKRKKKPGKGEDNGPLVS